MIIWGDAQNAIGGNELYKHVLPPQNMCELIKKKKTNKQT